MRFFKAFFTGLTGALAANLLILLILRPLVIDPTMPLDTLSVGPVSVFTVGGVIGATLVYASMRLLLENPDVSFVLISLVILFLSFIPDYLIIGQTSGKFAGANWGSALVLMLMHLVEALIVVLALTRLWGHRLPQSKSTSI